MTEKERPAAGEAAGEAEYGEGSAYPIIPQICGDGNTQNGTEHAAACLKTALLLCERGMAAIPLRGKMPVSRGWQRRRLAPDELRHAFAAQGVTGVGVVCGALSGNLVILDFDGAGWRGAYEHFRHAWPELDDTITVITGSGRRHIWLSCPDLPADFTRRSFRRGNAAIELRGNRCQCAVPPSRHPSGGKYRWEAFEAELRQAVFHDLIQWLSEWGTPVGAAAGDPEAVHAGGNDGHGAGAARRLPEVIREGERNTTLTSAAGSMRRRGMSEEGILAALRVENQRRCQPPLGDDELQSIARSVARYPPDNSDQRKGGWVIGGWLTQEEAERVREKGSITSPDPALRTRVIEALLERAPAGRGALPALLRRKRAGELVLDWLRAHGDFVRSEDDALFYFCRTERQLYNLASERWMAWLYSLTGANPAGGDFAYISTDCKTAALTAPRRRVVRVAAWDDETQTLRVSRFDGTVYVLDGKEITEEANGEAVLFDDSPSWTPYAPDFSSTARALRWQTVELPPWPGGKAEMYGLALRAWELSTFFTELCPTKSLLVLVGEKGSGKTMTLRVFLRMLYGPLAEVSGVPDKPDGFTAAAAAVHVLVLDNLDGFYGWLRDKLARAATGGEEEYRKLYTSNEAGRMRYRCWVAFTSRTPDTLRRDDLADRLVLLPLERLTQETLKAERDVLHQAQESRNAWWVAVLTSLNRVVADIRARGLAGTARIRMADWESLGRVCARAEGLEKEWDDFVDDLRGAQSAFLLEGNLIVDGLQQWLADEQNQGREVTARELHQELGGLLFGDKRPPDDWARSTVAFGKQLAGIRRELANIAKVEWAKGAGRAAGHRTIYRFWPL